MRQGIDGSDSAAAALKILYRLMNYYASVAYDHIVVAGDVTGGCVFHQLGRSCAELFCCGQHRDGRTEATHADVLLGDHVIQGAGVEPENWFNRTVVFHTRDGVGLVMVHVAGGDDQDAGVLGRDHIRNCTSEFRQSLELPRVPRRWERT